MRVRVLYFAAVRDLVGVAEEARDLPAGVGTVGAFVAWLEAARPELGGRLASVRVARNEEFAAAGDALADGDTLALIPPVAGG
jgi:molybdopterin synthase sulfur carrier subunit